MVFNLFPTNKELEQAQIYRDQFPDAENSLINSGNWLQKRDVADSYFGRSRPNRGGYRVAAQSPEFVEGFKNWVAERDAMGDWAGQQLSNLRQGSSNSGGNSIANRTRRNNVTPTGDNVVIVEPDPVTPPTVSTSVPASVPAAPIAAGSDSAGTWTPEYGDTLYSRFDGDWDKINAFAQLNNLKDVDSILADYTYKTPSQSYLNNYLSQR